MKNMISFLPTPGGLTGAPRRLLLLAFVLKDYDINVAFVSESMSQLSHIARKNGFDVYDLDPDPVLRVKGGALLKVSFFKGLRVFSGLFKHNYQFFRVLQSNKDAIVWIRSSKGIAFAGLASFFSGRTLIWDVDYEPSSKGLIRILHIVGLFISDKVVFQYSSAPYKIFGKKLVKLFCHKFHVVVPGIDLRSIRAEKKSALFLGLKNFSDKSFVVLQVGTICDRKNQLFLIDVMSALRRKGLLINIKLLFLGGEIDAHYLNIIQQKIRSDKLDEYVSFLGWRDDVHQIMRISNLLVMPSKDEGVPNTVQEAMCIGLPVMVSNSGGMSEIVKHGITGWLLDLCPEEWACQIHYNIENNDFVKKVSSAAADYANHQFDMNSWGSRYADLIKNR
ncbi:glycosyltransferase [Prosthecochloris sp. ZM_2]|nr:glycosyltransferase [Prosthecochloris sp. ZM_2]